MQVSESSIYCYFLNPYIIDNKDKKGKESKMKAKIPGITLKFHLFI